MRTFIALVVAFVTAVMSLIVAVPPATAGDYWACSEPLNFKRQTVHRFRSGGEVLPFGRVIVTATKQYPNRYCEQVDIGGRFLSHTYKRVDSEFRTVCTGEVFRVTAGGPYETTSYRQGLRVPNGACTVQKFSVSWQGERWTAKVRRQNP